MSSQNKSKRLAVGLTFDQFVDQPPEFAACQKCYQHLSKNKDNSDWIRQQLRDGPQLLCADCYRAMRNALFSHGQVRYCKVYLSYTKYDIVYPHPFLACEDCYSNYLIWGKVDQDWMENELTNGPKDLCKNCWRAMKKCDKEGLEYYHNFNSCKHDVFCDGSSIDHRLGDRDYMRQYHQTYSTSGWEISW